MKTYLCARCRAVGSPPRRHPLGTTAGSSQPPSLCFGASRSFEPILRLLPQGISPVSQHWATWALYNLVSVYRKHLHTLNVDSQLRQSRCGVTSGLASFTELCVCFVACSEQVLSLADQGGGAQPPGEGPGTGQLTSRDQGHGQVNSGSSAHTPSVAIQNVVNLKNRCIEPHRSAGRMKEPRQATYGPAGHSLGPRALQ